jgi:DNA (cytosine-5)-methyltransferase 1
MQAQKLCLSRHYPWIQWTGCASFGKIRRLVKQHMRLEASLAAMPATKNISTKAIYSMMDLFAGCGGLSLGFENSGFTPVFVNELNEDAISTYLINRNHSLGGLLFADNPDFRCNDAHELKKKKLEQLQSDWAILPEVRYSLDRLSSARAGGGSNLDIIAGGPPCQGFSGIGHRRSYGVDKIDLPSNHLYGRMAEIIRTLRPRIFLFENVRGLLNSKWEREGGELIWPHVLSEFRSIAGYEVRWKLVHARDYGVPQNRPRVLMVGVRKDVVEASSLLNPEAHPEDAVLCGFLPKPRPNEYPHLEDLLGDLIDPAAARKLRSGDFPDGRFETTKYPHDAKTEIQRLLRTPPPHWPKGKAVELTDQEYSKHKPNVVAKFDAMLKSGGEIPEEFQTRKFSQRLLRRRWGNQGPTITATTLPDDYVHYSQPRILTVREWARLQLFPDWYRFTGKRTTGGIRRAGNPRAGIFEREVPKYTQIGNAVPVELAERVGQHLKQILDDALGER